MDRWTPGSPAEEIATVEHDDETEAADAVERLTVAARANAWTP